ncbi:PQQ-binding-like beta-propeller repeat protein [Phaeospirillum tilakii]|uniref:PQQ-binding-like beta-propeller repeat protein n=1 Tax=Phaeospirillum tilakii TaxID=741673 RepID=A0ABW5C7X5_9PROT
MSGRASWPALALLLASALPLGGCDTGWLGEKAAPPLPGKRISVLSHDKLLEPEIAGPAVQVVLPPPEPNDEWPQAGGFSNHAMHHMEVAGNLHEAWSSDAGSGSGKRRRLLGQPVVAENHVFTVDADSQVTAFDARTGKRLWRADTIPDNDFEVYTSGGIAYDEGRLFVATGFAQVVALDARTGRLLWRQTVSGPMRGAPTVRGGRVFAITVDNQTYALAADDGAVLWTHSGIAEIAGLLAGNSPAVDGNMVVVPYSSGELFALRVDSGVPIWQDSLVTIRRTETVGALMDIRGRPIIDRGRVYAISNGDMLVCLDQRTGRRLWEKEIGGVQSPWIAGDFLFLVTTHNEAIALEAKTGRVVWVTQMQTWKDPSDKSGRVLWSGPVLASDRLILGSSNGLMVALSPYTGDMLGWQEAPDGVTIPPVVANGTLYFLTDDAELVAYR